MSFPIPIGRVATSARAVGARVLWGGDADIRVAIESAGAYSAGSDPEPVRIADPRPA